MSQHKPLPPHIKPYGSDFLWSNELLWGLKDIPVEEMSIDKLTWHFDIPWLHTPNERFNLKPKDILLHPELYPDEYNRTMRADTSYPIDIIYTKGRWLILDGLHRLMKSVDAGETIVKIRKIPDDAISKIQID